MRRLVLRELHLQIERVRRRRRRNIAGLLEGVIIMRAGPRSNKGAVNRWLYSLRFKRLSAIEARLLLYAAAAMGVAALSILPVANIASRAQNIEVHIPVLVDGQEIEIVLRENQGPQVDDSTYVSERSNPDTGSWSVRNPDGTSIAHLDYYRPDGNPAVEDVFNPGTDCKFDDAKDKKPVEHHVDECRPTQSGDLVIFNVTYYEYTYKGVRRRISHAVPTEKPCNDDAYRVDAQTALGWDEHWPYRGIKPPPQPVCTATPQGRIRPMLVANAPENSNYVTVIWIDEKGNQFPAIYKPDGTSIWEATGTVPPKPSKEDVAKREWQFTPDSIKQAQDLAKELQKAVEDPNSVRNSLGNGSGAGAAMTSEELRAYLQVLLKKDSNDCKILVPQQPKTPLKTAKPEVPKSTDKKPNADKTKQSSRPNTRQPSTAGSPALDPAISIGIGIGGLLGGMHGHGDHNFGGREGGRE
jgi:hypothetical protein